MHIIFVLYFTRDRLLKLQKSDHLELQYNNNGLKNNYAMRLKASCLRSHWAYI